MYRFGLDISEKHFCTKTKEECEEKFSEIIKTMKAEIAKTKNKRSMHKKRVVTESGHSPQKLHCSMQVIEADTT